MKSTNLIMLSEESISRIIEMAWEDRTAFDAIYRQFGLREPDVMRLMQRELKPSAYRLWRKRVRGRKTKHQALRGFVVGRDHCPTQYKHRTP